MSNGQSRPDPYGGDGGSYGEEGATRSVVTLISDFGKDEHYVGVMKGVILAVNPSAHIVDITHAVTPYDVRQAALILSAACHYFPEGTVHVAVVDPGVGGDRRGVVVATQNYYFVGPDNGLFSYIFDDPLHMWTRELVEDAYFMSEVSSTFHGRDIFAPVAAHLSLGVPPEDFGPIITDPVRFESPKPEIDSGGVIRGEVIYIDHYGNLITNIDTSAFWRWETGSEEDGAQAIIEIGERQIEGMSEYYQAVPAGQVGAHFNSWARLEIFVPEGSAAGELGLGIGAEVRIRFGRAN